MNLDQLRKRAGNGFHPFTLHLSDGRKLPVRHPEYLVIGDDDFANVIGPLHIVSIEEPSDKKE